jgi:hypothetical protein
MASAKKIIGGLGKVGERLFSKPVPSSSADKALPLVLPRANLSSEFINAEAERVARQMLGEHVTSGRPKETFNLAGRSMKENQRVKGLDYVLKPTGTVAKEVPYSPKKGEVKVALPGDQTVSDKTLESLGGVSIDSPQQGGAYYGLGQKHLDEPEFWKSNESAAKGVQGKVDRIADYYEPDRVVGTHLAMGQTSNNFAMHFADANLKAIDWSKASPKKISVFDNIVAGGYVDNKGNRVTFPNWPGLADPEAALKEMSGDSNLRKWFNNRMKVPSITEPLGLPNGLDIQYAITEPRIRDMEINMTGLMTGDLKPGALVEAAGAPHKTYTHRILGEAGGPQEVLTPFAIDFPDAAAHIALTKRPADFTGTIQKVFPHQIVDDQYINQYNQYRDRIKQLTGKKDGGAIQDDDQELKAMIADHLDSQAHDQELRAMVDNHLAGGGAPKAIAKGFKKLFGNDVLPVAEREANLQKFLEPSEMKGRVYHGTADTQIRKFGGNRGVAAHFGLEPKVANQWANDRNLDVEDLRHSGDIGPNEEAGGMVYPAHVQVKKIFDVRKPEHSKLIPELHQAIKEGRDIGFTELESAIDDIKKKGFDSYYDFEHGHLSEPTPNGIAVFESNQIKSSLGNRGTYDINEDDINKAGGGVIHMAGAGRVGRGIAKGFKSIFGGADEVAPAIQGGTRRFGSEDANLNIIKETGGNWLGGSAEKALKPLRRRTAGGDDPVSAIEKLNKSFPDATKRPEYVDANIGRLQQDAALNKWLESNLTNYVKKQMGTADDPVRKLAEEGIAHLPKNNFADNIWVPEELAQRRKQFGFPEDEIATSNLAKTWEQMADEAINSSRAGEHTKPLTEFEKNMALTSNVESNPWLTKLDPNTPIYRPEYEDSFGSLGFDHIMDVLRQDVAAGRIRPEQLSKVSMEQAVRRTAEFDQEMAKRMQEAQIKNTAGMPTHKEYPDQGFKWIQLSQPEELPKGWSQEASGAYIGPNGERTIVNPAYQSLNDALKYEGDTMGHCVGSYCDDVAEGNSRIYSLRDAKGEPHVTIETEPNPKPYPVSGEAFAMLPSKTKAEYGQYVREWRQRNPDVNELTDEHTIQALKEAGVKPQPDRIVQIKGKGNAKPKEEYLPFVQDFVKGGNWSDVGDLQNTGLVKYEGKIMTQGEADDLLYKQLNESNPGLTDELGLTTPPPEGMAEGGGAFKKIQFMDKGGVTTSGGDFSAEDVGADSYFSDEFKRRLAGLKEDSKTQMEKEYRQLGRAGGKKDLALRVGAQLAGGLPDVVNMGLEGVDYLQSKVPALSRPASVLDFASSRDRVPKFSLSSENPWLGSERIIDSLKEAKLLGDNEYPFMELASNFAVPVGAAALLKGGKKAAKGAKAMTSKPQGGLSATAR